MISTVYEKYWSGILQDVPQLEFVCFPHDEIGAMSLGEECIFITCQGHIWSI